MIIPGNLMLLSMAVQLKLAKRSICCIERCRRQNDLKILLFRCRKFAEPQAAMGHFVNRSAFIKPTEEWERYGCEDPRVTHFGKYYTFYTAFPIFHLMLKVSKLAWQ
jgi:hypothetical protein